VKVLIVDEVSMISAALFHHLERLARRAKKKDAAFGGIQLILSGDFYQLPPVIRESDLYPVEGREREGEKEQEEDEIRFLSSFLKRKSSKFTSVFMAAFQKEKKEVQDDFWEATQYYRFKKMCFEAKSWPECVHIRTELTQVFRQTESSFVSFNFFFFQQGKHF